MLSITQNNNLKSRKYRGNELLEYIKNSKYRIVRFPESVKVILSASCTITPRYLSYNRKGVFL